MNDEPVDLAAALLKSAEDLAAAGRQTVVDVQRTIEGVLDAFIPKTTVQRTPADATCAVADCPIRGESLHRISDYDDEYVGACRKHLRQVGAIVHQRR